MHFRKAFIATALAVAPVWAGGKSVNVYWGQNGADTLESACESDGFEYITLGFINSSPENGNGTGYPGDNFGAHCWAETYSNNGRQSHLYTTCPSIQTGIAKCQANGKKVLLSIGGEYNGTTSNYTVSNAAKGIEFANFMWNAFGPYNSSWTGPRPFDDPTTGTKNVVDGYDFDIEYPFADETGYAAMIKQLRSLITAAKRSDVITGAPQCPLQNANVDMQYLLQNSQFDLLFIQFYNNEQCNALNADGTVNSNFNYAQWEDYLKTTPNKAAKLFIGLPGSPAAAKTGYIGLSSAKTLLCKYKDYPQFGGAMIWDQYYGELNTNLLTGRTYYELVHDILNGGCDGSATSTTRSATTSTSSSCTTVTTPANVQAGIVSNCVKFYETQTGDYCQAIADKFKITLDQFYDWNPILGRTCSNLWAQENYCVGVGVNSCPATSTTTTSRSSSTSSSVFTTSTVSSTRSSSSSTVSSTSSTRSSSSSSPISSTTSHITSSSSSSSSSSHTTSSSSSSPSLSSTHSSTSSQASSTQASSTQVSSTSTRSSSSTLVSSTQVSSTQVSSTQVSSTQVSSTQASSTSSHVSSITSYDPTTSTSASLSTSTSASSSSSSSAAVTTSSSSSSAYSATSSSSSEALTTTSSSSAVVSTTSTSESTTCTETSVSSTEAVSSTTSSSSEAQTTTSSASSTAVSSETSTSLESSTSATEGVTSSSSLYSTSATEATITSSSASVSSTRTPYTNSTITSATYSVTSTSVLSSTEGQSTSSVILTTSTLYTTTVYTITSCAPTVTNCPGKGHVTTEVIPYTTTVCPVTESPAAPTTTSAPAPVSYSTSTVYTTKVYTITSCPAAVPNCPAKGSATTEIVPVSTTVIPVVEVPVTVVPVGEESTTTTTQKTFIYSTITVPKPLPTGIVVNPGTNVTLPSGSGYSKPTPSVTSGGSGCTGPSCPATTSAVTAGAGRNAVALALPALLAAFVLAL